MESCLYEGRLRHRRREPVAHAFSYRLFMAYLDLDELDEVFRGRWLWSTRRPALAWFRRADYLGDRKLPLAQAVRALVAERTGQEPRGPIRVLTHLRTFGYVFNPVTFYYCYDAAAARVETIVAEVHNTPWNERHAYVLSDGGSALGPGHHRYVFAKAFHVSPFMAMDHVYDWRFVDPGRRLVVHMDNLVAGRSLFDATMVLERRPITGRSLARALLAYPLMPARVMAAIYLQAARLRLKGIPFHSHPAEPPAALPPRTP